jgi:hypothetical protein
MFTNIRREVALLALPVLTFAAVVLCHLIHANPATTTWVTTAAAAAGTIVVTALATPPHPQLIGGAVIALFNVLAHYWWHIPADIQAPALIVIMLLFGMPLSNRITPVSGSARPRA